MIIPLERPVYVVNGRSTKYKYTRFEFKRILKRTHYSWPMNFINIPLNNVV